MDLGGIAAERGLQIGGYLGLELPDHGDSFPTTLKFQSGRAALRAVLESGGITRVLLPAYICDSVIRAVVDSGAVVETYSLNDALYPRTLPEVFSEGSAFLYVNYFGLCDENVSRLVDKIPHDRLIVDNSQALLAPPAADAYATIYSPRKFVGVPDGGLAITPGRRIRTPEHEDAGSVGRGRRLFMRTAGMTHEGYADHVASEESLSDSNPLMMSRLTRRMLAGIDMGDVRRRRRENFLALASRLDRYNCRKSELGAEAVPLCYPFVVGRNVESLKAQLLARQIYIPTYWPEARSRISDGVERQLIDCCLAVPCDQRYTPAHMDYVAAEIIAELGCVTK